MNDRTSEAEIPPLIVDPVELARREASNALDQFDWAIEEVERWIKAKEPNFKVSTLLKLHRLAMDGVDQYAGNFRPASVVIKGSKHIPVAGDDVPRQVEDMIEYVLEHWNTKTAIHLSSYVMWRLNWIHPFADGNGRTSRILSYLVLCGRLRQVLPGTRTIPEQISENKKPYYDALESADFASKRGTVDVGEMERLLEGYVANQLIQVHEQATGTPIKGAAEVVVPESGPLRNIFDSIEHRPVLYGVGATIVVALLALFFG